MNTKTYQTKNLKGFMMTKQTSGSKSNEIEKQKSISDGLNTAKLKAKLAAAEQGMMARADLLTAKHQFYTEAGLSNLGKQMKALRQVEDWMVELQRWADSDEVYTDLPPPITNYLKD